MNTIDETGKEVTPAPVGKLTDSQIVRLLSLDRSWKNVTTFTRGAKVTFDSLADRGLVEKAWRSPSSAYRRATWWYRLTDHGHLFKEQMSQQLASSDQSVHKHSISAR